MKILLFDVETTGLPKTKKPAIEGPNNWPHIVSISWLILDNNIIVKKRDYIIKPEGWIIPQDSTRIHGITTEDALEKGFPLLKVMSEFMAEIFDGLVAHNIEFDYNVVMNAIRWDLGIEFKGFSKPLICTMKLSTEKCKLNSYWGGFKYPSLSELYFEVFKRKPDEKKLHGSLYDVMCLSQCIQHCEWLQKKVYTEDDTSK